MSAREPISSVARRRVRSSRTPYLTRTTVIVSPRSQQARPTTSGSRASVQVDPLESLETSCIDLTDDDQVDEIIVDLTSVNDSPVVRVGSRTRNHSTVPLGRVSPVVIDQLDESSTELPEIDFGQSNKSLLSSPDEGKVMVQCPICFDSVKEIKRTQRQLMSTICGHLFCNTCIMETISTRKCCPSCRKRLTNRQVHAIYL